MKILSIIGAGGQAAESAMYAKALGYDNYVTIVDEAYLADTPGSKSFSDPVEAAATCAIGAPGLKKRLIAKWQGDFVDLIHPIAWVEEGVRHGVGLVVAPQAAVLARASLGDHVLINAGATISHDCTIGNYVTVSPGAHLGGAVTVGDGVFIGIGSTIIQGVRIGEGAIVNAGATVIEDVPALATVVGTPAKVITIRKEWLDAI